MASLPEDVEQFIKRKSDEFCKKNIVNVKDIGRKGRHFFIREAWTFMPQTNLRDKVFILERFRKDSTEGELAYKDQWRKGDIEYRIGYFIKGKIGKTAGRWLWGQYCPLIPQEDLNSLLDKAKTEGTLL